MNWPNPLSNSTSFGSWMNSLLRACRASELVSVKGGRLTKTPNGTTLVIDRQGVAASTSASLQQFKIVSDGGDYWLCKTWDGTTLGTDNVRLTKPKKLRAGSDAITSETIRGVVQSYTFTPVNIGAVVGYYVRNVTVGGSLVERQILIPDMMPNDILDALPHENYAGQLETASVSSAGSGYTNGDTLTLVGGTGSAATFTAVVSAGVLTGVTITNPGAYTAFPASPASVSGGTGSGASVSFTTQSGLKAMVDGCTWAEM